MAPKRLSRPLPPPAAPEENRSVASAAHFERQKRLAKGRLERAFQLRVDGNDSAARQALAEAVRLDPALVTNSTAISLAETLTNQPRDRAVMSLLDDSQTAPVVSRPTFIISRQGYAAMASCIFLIAASAVLSTVFYMFIAPMANQLLTRAGIVAVNAARLDNTLRPMAAAPTWPIIDTAIVMTVLILVSVCSSYIIGHWLGGAGAFDRYLFWLICPYGLMFGVMAVALIIIRNAGNTPPEVNSFDGTFSAGVWLLESALPVTLVINSLIASRVHEIKWSRGGAAVLVCTALLVALFGILAGFTLIPKM